jgi:hypothetical protein
MSSSREVTEPKRTEPERPGSELLLRARLLAMFACVLGAGASLVFMYQVGHRQPSFVLVLLFTVWVLSPFVALLVGALVSASWAAPSRAALHGVMFAVSVLSPAVYGVVALGPPRPQPAFAFLVVPLAAWCLGAGALAVISLIGGRSARRGARA